MVMHKKILLICFLLGLMSFSKQQSYEEVAASIRSGNTEKIGFFLDESIYLTLPGKSSNLDRNSAKMAIHDFIASNPVRQFQIIHKGGNQSSGYFIGNLVTLTKTYRTTIYIKTRDSKAIVQEIRIESN
jgi:hypothetical protein